MELSDADFTEDPRGRVTESEILVGEGKLKVSTLESDGSSSFDVIYISEKDELMLVNHKRGSYSVFDRAWVEDFKNQVSMLVSGAKQSGGRIGGFTRRELRRLSERWKANELDGNESDSLVRNTGERERIGGFEAIKFSTTLEGESTKEIWVSDIESLDPSEELIELSVRMSSFYEDLLEIYYLRPRKDVIPSLGSSWIEQIQRFRGIPMRIKFLDETGASERWISVESISNVAMENGDFAPPTNFSDESLP